MGSNFLLYNHKAAVEGLEEGWTMEIEIGKSWWRYRPDPWV